MPFEFPRGSITLDFAKKAVSVAVETFERAYNADQGNGTAYTPGDEGLFSIALETADLGVELRDGGAVWRAGVVGALGCTSVISDGANTQFKNNAVAARNLIGMRHHLSTATYERYNTQDLAATASYTPGDEGLFSHASEDDEIVCEYKYNAAWWLWGSFGSNATLTSIGDGTNLRYRNTNGANARQLVIMRALM